MLHFHKIFWDLWFHGKGNVLFIFQMIFELFSVKILIYFCVIIKEYVVVLTWQFSWICAYIFLIFMKLKQPLVYILKLYRFMCTVGKSKFHFRIRYMYLFSNSSVNFSCKIGSIYSVFSRNFCKWLKGGLDFQEKNQK